ncbi:Tfp pilus assembly protein PilN [Halobacteroides halobius DSM 5150]|uniref:Tfp pilus assembly protein PilN n=1 Tax=Halobacteroides halobius (strain ATCC 35273 / DSM 5150 / MD-1) TaxID=748449 RepID=L0K5E3_HALHC|nr:PilN domain-containing protein [Halobacteroides halobius]AGB40497.1 Tfp pilus assembly protein PilN [Halobacteroides halobius DSM 5150]
MINLLPAELKRKRKRLKLKRYLILLAVILISLLTGINFYLQALIIDTQDDLVKVEEQVRKLKFKADKLEAKVQVLKQQQIISQLSNKLSYTRVVKDLNIIIPPGVWLTGFIINQGKLLVIGEGTNQQIINTIERLAKYPYFKQVNLVSTKEEEEGFQFQVSGRLGYGAQ